MEIWHFNKYFERKYFEIKTRQGWWDNVYEKMTFYGLAKLKSFKLFVSDDDDNDGWLQKANEARVFVAEFQNVITTRVAEVARARERRSPKSLDSDENFNP